MDTDKNILSNDDKQVKDQDSCGKASSRGMRKSSLRKSFENDKETKIKTVLGDSEKKNAEGDEILLYTRHERLQSVDDSDAEDNIEEVA